VWQVKVAAGDTVESGDELIILESMKMEIPVVAPVSGTVSAIHVSPDDRVQEGDALAELG
jgi:biotin carboxyl carrier protein